MDCSAEWYFPRAFLHDPKDRELRFLREVSVSVCSKVDDCPWVDIFLLKPCKGRLKGRAAPPFFFKGLLKERFYDMVYLGYHPFLCVIPCGTICKAM